MKLVLDKSDYRFAETTLEEQNLKFRFLFVRVGDRLFRVRREISEAMYYWNREKFDAQMDEFLVEEMEHMLTKIFEKSVQSTPDGEVKF